MPGASTLRGYKRSWLKPDLVAGAALSAALAVAMAGVLALLIGVFLMAGRVFKLGFVTGLLSGPIRVGYLNGIALAVIVSQLPRLLGIDSSADGTLARLASLANTAVSGGINPLHWLWAQAALPLLLPAASFRGRFPASCSP